MSNTKIIGDSGEEMAVDFLIENGYKIITRNYRTRFGEIDIIAKDQDVLVFVEVKKKSSGLYGTPAEMITPRKLFKIIKTAQSYLVEKRYKKNWRIDAVLILGEKIEIRKNLTI